MTKQRTNSDSGATPAPLPSKSSHLRSISSLIRRKGSNTSNHKSTIPSSETDLADTYTLRQTDSVSYREPESLGRELQSLVQRMRSAPSGASHVDQAYKEFIKVKDRCTALCLAIIRDEIKPLPISPSATETSIRPRDSDTDSPHNLAMLDNRSSFSGKSLAEVVSAGGGNRLGIHGSELWMGPIRDWKACVETLNDAFRASLAETYMSYEKDATSEMLETLFANKTFRREAVRRMRRASVTRVLSADPQFFPRYEIRFRNYERAKEELNEIRQIVQTAESGISPSRQVREFTISDRGDALLEFANNQAGCSPEDPVLRFRVSSFMLAETSPIFARMFSGQASSLQVHEAEDITQQLPPPPIKYYCKDGTDSRLYRMPQRETNHQQSLEILMHAAHMRNEKVPRDVSFDQFVAIAKCSIRYKCTSPLELMVEHRWLPQWMHRGADDMPDGLLLISYAFGSRGLFTRMSKSAILNLVDENDLQSKPWPQKIKDKIWAVRSTKIAQLHDCCTAALQEYTNPPTSPQTAAAEPEEPPPTIWGSLGAVAPQNPTLALTTTPRCPKGSHWCDATNLGWLMVVFNNMNMLSTVTQSKALSKEAEISFAPRSLAEVVDMLRLLPSPPAPVHRGGVCDPIPSFRTAVADIYNSVTGLTLYDISGKSHGWALSKHAMTEPQSQVATGLGRMAATIENYTVATEFPERVLLQILGEITDIEDLHAAAQVNRAFYETYKTYELLLMRNILRVGRTRSGVGPQPVPLTANNAEDKMRKSESDHLKDRMNDDRAESAALDSDDFDGQETDLYSDLEDDEMPMAATPAEPADGPNDQLPMQRASVAHPAQTASERRQRSAPSVPAQHEDDLYEPPMTHEEARRILWPDDHDEPAAPSGAGSNSQGSADATLNKKFLLDDGLVTKGLEAKTLILVNEKRLVDRPTN